ncbi:methionine--tRNA ligase subunit beta [Edaphobacter flagellatus]|uniref:methionine--tRNA ligase subunit beta n=1 Tax=Edaphobacter flagellatus TaxID=1933044 RepID=UPI0021B3C115|nr:methionine--tRNA ligase subunit beta [Edaphobacter flagellatus]
MSEAQKKFYVTTPIYYVNARPHIGHAYTTIAADVIARRQRLLLGTDEHDQPNVWFLTGTDEHGQKVQRSAQAAGITPQQFTDEVSAQFRSLWQRMGITNNDYIRTTEPRHVHGVQKLFNQLYERGHIYLDTYTGQYSVGEEMFVDGPPGTIGPDGKPTETVTEENFYFRLSAFQAQLIDLIESGEFAIEPETRRNEVLSFVRGNISTTTEGVIPSGAQSAEPRNPRISPEAAQASPESNLAYSAKGTPYIPGALKDLSISRSSFDWGIPVPEPAASTTQKKHVIYVWLDALANYMTAIGYGSDKPEDIAKLEKFWPADIHLVGKEIIRFHCVYWPAFLLAAGLPLPKKVQAHGWLLFEESKMSKSRGNIVRAETILDAFGSLKPKPTDGPGPELNDDYWKHEQDLFGADVLRYFLLREIPFGQDGSFSFDALVQRYNADLANGYGNLVSRTLKMISDNFSGSIPAHEDWSTVTIQIVDRIRTGGSVGQIDPNTFHTISDTELSRFAKALCVYYEKGFEILKFSQPVDFEEGRRTLIHENRIERDTLSVLDSIFLLIQQADGYISKNEPWKLAKRGSEEDKHQLSEILYNAAESIRIITALLYPILPYATAKVWEQLGLGDIEEAARNGELTNLQWGGLKPGTKLGALGPIFPRAPKELIQQMTDAENPTTPIPSKLVDEKIGHVTPAPADSAHPGAAPRTSELPAENPGAQVGASSAPVAELPKPPASHAEAPASGLFAAAATSSTSDTPQIAIDDFVKIDLRVARVLVAERIPKADKLLRLEVDLGYEKRQILSGIAQWYTPEELIGRRIIIVANLAPRKMRGLESHGMLLAASHGEDGKPILATFAESDEIALGSRLK